MYNLLSYCGLVDAKIRASDIDLPVLQCIGISEVCSYYIGVYCTYVEVALDYCLHHVSAGGSL